MIVSDNNELVKRDFESWAKLKGHSVKWYIDQYDSQKVQWMYEAWVAATSSDAKATIEAQKAEIAELVDALKELEKTATKWRKSGCATPASCADQCCRERVSLSNADDLIDKYTATTGDEG